MKKIVVFGASGDTGKYFVRYFLDLMKVMNIRLLQQELVRRIILNNLKFPIIELILQRKKNFLNCQKTFMLWLILLVRCQRE